MTLGLRFGPELEARFTDDTESARLQGLRDSNAVGCAAWIIMLPVAWLLLPDAHEILVYLFAGGVVPLTFACSMLLRTRLSLAAKEFMQAAVAVATGVAIGVLYSSSRYTDDAYLFSSLMLVAVAARTNIRAKLALNVALTLVFEIAIWRMPAVTAGSAIGLAISWAFTTFFVLHGSWRFETAMRRSYAVGLLAQAMGDDLARANEELGALLGRDTLTGLANRRSYDDWMSLHWAGAASAGGNIGLIVVDIDSFKRYNDHYGHSSGDACLRAVAEAMRHSLRGTTDYIARIGGEEFVVLLPGVALALVADIAERLRVAVKALELPHAGAGPGMTVTVSCGAASFIVSAGVTPAKLFEAADTALYSAKESGRDRVCLAVSEPLIPAVQTFRVP